MNKQKNEYIKGLIKLQPPYVQELVNEYIQHAKDNGARIGNDGFPDARFSCTKKYRKVRSYIDRCRKLYEYDYLYYNK